MKKSDLKPRMLVQVSDGAIGLIIDDLIIFNDNGYDILNNFNEDLTSVVNIDKISNVITADEGLRLNMWEETLKSNLLWERKSETIEIAGKKFAKNEMENALKDLKPIE